MEPSTKPTTGKPLTIEDRIYGTYKFSEPVLVELIESDAVQRLKGIAQFGVPDVWYHKKGFFRFEHDVGVAILLSKLGAAIEEQIAGLLHDVSHTAFSHVVDYVVGSTKDEDFQDRILFDFISSDSQIPPILDRHGFDIKDFRTMSKFTLLERPEPELCADRVDYCLRELLVDGDVEDVEVVKMCVSNIMAVDSKMCFSSKNPARLFGDRFLKLQRDHWAGRQAVGRYYILADALKEGMRTNLISFEDFKKDDEYLVRKLESSSNPKIKNDINMLLNGHISHVNLPKKLRYVDPYYVENGKLLKLSENDKEFYEKFLKTVNG